MNKKIAVAGASKLGRYIALLKSIDTIAVWDKHESDIGTVLNNNLKIEAIPQKIDKDYLDYVIITTMHNTGALYEELCQVEGLPTDKIKFPVEVVELFRDEPDIYQRLSKYVQDLANYEKKTSASIPKTSLYPMLFNWDAQAASMASQYFFQDLWAARKIFGKRPEKHLDIGSRVDGFISSLLAFMDVTLIDIRPLDQNIDGLSFICADATSLEGIEDSSIQSLSSLCALEHFGLGGFGGDIDPEGDYKAMKSIQRVIKCGGGAAYISVPIGKDAVAFNAHRIYAPQTIISRFDRMKLIEFSAIVQDKNNNVTVVKNAKIGDYSGLDDSCLDGHIFGLFEFEKR